jgi:hypothetical protein
VCVGGILSVVVRGLEEGGCMQYILWRGGGWAVGYTANSNLKH